MSLNIGDVLAEIEGAGGDPGKLFLILTHYRTEAFTQSREDTLKEMIPLVCGSCLIGKSPLRNEGGKWRHVAGGVSWACQADPILKELEVLMGVKPTSHDADAGQTRQATTHP
jgi:hypothetical protein